MHTVNAQTLTKLSDCPVTTKAVAVRANGNMLGTTVISPMRTLR